MRWQSGGTTALVVACALALPLAGCDALGIGGKKEEKSSKDEATSTSTSTATATATTTAQASTTTTQSATATASQTVATASASATDTASASASTTASASATTSATAAALPGHTPVPTLEEWGQVNEVTVVNSSKLGCESKALREWVRISCRNKNDTGGTPTTVVVDKGGGKGDTFTLAQNNITSLVFPFAEGTDLEATFGWSDKKSKFKSLWPAGAPKPPTYGAFEASPAPVAGAEPKLPGIPSAARPILKDARDKLKPILTGKLPAPPPKK